MPIVCKVINNPDTLDKNLTKVVSKTIYTLDEQDIIFEQSVKEDYKQTLKRQLEFKKIGILTWQRINHGSFPISSIIIVPNLQERYPKISLWNHYNQLYELYTNYTMNEITESIDWITHWLSLAQVCKLMRLYPNLKINTYYKSASPISRKKVN